MDFNANKYNESNSCQVREAKLLINKIGDENNNKDYDIILDIGCGTGNITLMLNECLSAKHIYAIDVDEDMIGFAKQNHKKQNISYFVEDFGQAFDQLSPEIQALEGKVSMVFSNYCLHWIKDKENAVKNLRRLLSKGGQIYTNIYWTANYFNDLSSEEKAFYEKQILNVPSRETQMDIWINLFNNNGFEIISHQYSDTDCKFEKDYFIEYLLPIQLNCQRLYLVTNYFDDCEKLSKLIESKLLSNCRYFTNDSTGEDMIEFKYGFFQFVVKS